MFRSYSAVGRDRHSCVLESSVRLSGFVGSLRACTFLYGDPDGERRDGGTRRTEGTENGVGGAAEERFCVTISALRRFPRGVRWGEMWKPHCGRAPDCAKETSLPGLSSFDSRCGCVLRGEGLGYSEDLTGSNLWPDGSGCMRRPFLAWHGGKWNRHNPAVN